MKGLDARRLTYITTSGRSDNWISRQTGIPRSTIGFVRRGQRNLPVQYKSTLRNIYQKESYTNMRQSGFPSHQARRFSSYAPESISIKSLLMKSQINRLSIGVTGQMIDKMDRLNIPYNIESVWGEAYLKVLKGMQDSRKPIELILQY